MRRAEWYSTRGRGVARGSAGAVGLRGDEEASKSDGRRLRGGGSSNGSRGIGDSTSWKPRWGRLVDQADLMRCYARQPGDPAARPLRIYALDPGAMLRDGRNAIVDIPYETLKPGPVGSVLAVVGPACAPALDLNEPTMALGAGRPASPADPLFRKQMVYAVAMGVYSEFRAALGRDVGWGFQFATTKSPMRLRLRVDGIDARNAYYDPNRGEVVFGCYDADDQPGGLNLSGGRVHTALSHDIVTHELTHALLDGLRPRYNAATSPDALAFHEALADLVALFRKFSYPDVVRPALAASRGRLGTDSALTAIAKQFGDTTGLHGPLRSALQDGLGYRTASQEPHERGQVLVAAVWRAFEIVYDRKIARYVRLASEGRGVLPDGELPAELRELLVREAHKLATQFLRVVIRAIDYCPPVDIQFGEFLRALLTADVALVPDDTWGFREAFVQGFRELGIEPPQVQYLSEDVLLWHPPEGGAGPIAALSFANLEFAGDPGRPASTEALHKQATALWDHVTRPEHARFFGLVAAEERGDEFESPCVESIRTTRRIGPDGQIVFDLVAEVTQLRLARPRDTERMEFFGGSTVIVDPDGRVRYVVRKDVRNGDRLQCQWDFSQSPTGRRYWKKARGALRPVPSFHQLLDGEAPR